MSKTDKSTEGKAFDIVFTSALFMFLFILAVIGIKDAYGL